MQYVLKVAPVQVYEFFGKDFEEECRLHSKVAKGTEHVVRIVDMLEPTLVRFGDQEMLCHVSVLEFVDGKPLSVVIEKIAEQPRLKAHSIAQIAVDLFRILAELESNGVHHNDLHAGNIMVQALPPRSPRAEAIDEYLRVVAIDLGSLADSSKSDTLLERWGDIHWVARHLLSLVDALLHAPEEVADLDYRLASALEERAHLFMPDLISQRAPSFKECIEDIKAIVQQVSSPWTESLRLRRFNDAYNAQTLAPWFVPLLLVDPNGRWVARISTPGPQIITGMRGCGKTMLLRAVQLHARAALLPDQTRAQVVERLKRDGFVGLYVSCTRLLDKLGAQDGELHAPYERLFIAYGIEAIRAVRNVKELDRSSVANFWFRSIAEAISDYMSGADEFRNVSSELALERQLLKALVMLSRGEAPYVLRGHPSEAFPHLANAIAKCSPLWSGAQVFFLLDDVSTRYLYDQNILKLLSSLLFSKPLCAFKITTEAQTLAIVLRSVGHIETARAGRDYEIFDLGAEVNEKMKERRSGGGADFIEDILMQRAKYYRDHPRGVSPRNILGDSTLDSVAQRIVTTSDTSRIKKEIYHGISCLAAVCVGDVGDVISLYELILRASREVKEFPVSTLIQSECYQNFCTRKLYDLNRREGRLKNFALSFAEAAHDLLIRSYREVDESGEIHRLRQYNSIYVRITTGDFDWQYEQIRVLIDAGVFVLAGGSDAPRTKTRDSDPIQQFKITYRKMLGLSNFIGLSERDRFELSGGQLEEWLRAPSAGREILLRNLGGADDSSETIESESMIGVEPSEGAAYGIPEQQVLFELWRPGDQSLGGEEASYPQVGRQPRIRTVKYQEMSKLGIQTALLGLGFEERALASARKLAQAARPETVVALRYHEQGHGKEIEKLIAPKVKSFLPVNYEDFVSTEIPAGNLLVDISSLTKPVIFSAVRTALRKRGRVWLCRTQAESYYPLNQSIKPVLKAVERNDHYKLLEELSKILMGEIGPYKIESLINSDADESRRRVLFAFSSAKHQRLLSLIDERSYEHADLIVPQSRSARSRIAAIVAEVAARNFPSYNVRSVDGNDLKKTVEAIAESYGYWYGGRGFNFELGLTGSKLQAVAAAIASTMFKISHCWYVSPKEFDVQRFTKGVGRTSFWEISL